MTVTRHAVPAQVTERQTTSGTAGDSAARFSAAAASTASVAAGILSMGTETTWSGTIGSNVGILRQYMLWLSQDIVDTMAGAVGATAVLGGDTGVFGAQFSADAASLYRVPESDYTITGTSPNPKWFTPSMLAGYGAIANYPGTTDGEPLGTFPVTFDSGGYAVWVLVLDTIATGTGAFEGTTRQRTLFDTPFVFGGGAADVATVDVNDEPPWPLRVVDAGGPAYRIGPDWNPDGGLLRIVDPATGRAWKQGVADPDDLGSTDYLPDSWTFHDHTDGAWEDDGPTSLDTNSDGLSVRYVRPAELDVDDANHVAYCDVYYSPPDPPDPAAVATGARVVRRRPQPSSGTVNVEFMDSTGSTVFASETGSSSFIFTSDPAQIADVAANGCIQRLHAGDVAEVTEWEQAWLSVSWTIPGSAPLRYFDPAVGVVTTLPMIPDA